MHLWTSHTPCGAFNGNLATRYGNTLTARAVTPRASHSPAVATAADASVPAAYLGTGTKTNKGSLRKEEFSGLTAPEGSPARKGGQSCRSLSHLVTLSQQSGSRERRTWGLRSLPLLFEVSAYGMMHPTCRAGPPILTNLI